MIQSGDDTEEVNQNQLNGNQDYENGDVEMDVGFEGGRTAVSRKVVLQTRRSVHDNVESDYG